MNFTLLAKRELEIINRLNFRYPLAVAEKDYFLALVSKIIYESSLGRKLVFKGGTALYHCYLNQMRFSEDLDFTSRDRKITLDEVRKMLQSYEFFEIKKEYTSNATIKIERLSYSGPLHQPNSLKVEIDFVQNVVLPAQELEYKNIWKVNTRARVMDIREICAEKIRVASDRARYRDFYDLCQIFRNFNLNLKEIIELVKQKEIRNPISKESIFKNWGIAKQEKIGEIQRIYYSKEVADSEINSMIEKFSFPTIG